MSIDQAHTSPRWRRSTFGRFARVFNGSDYTAVEVDSGGYPVYGSGGEFRRASDYLFEGESVLFGRKGTIDRPLYVNGRFWTVDTMFYTDIDTRTLLPRFAYYWATTLPYGEWATDTALPSMTSTAIKAAPIVVPPMVEQRAIADFLDRETAQIDAFIAKNEELIDLLTERRTATITRCVTSGFSGSAGLQEGHWTASVPDHWQVMPLRYAIRRIDQGVSPQAEAGLAVDAGQVGVLKSGCVNGGVFQPSEHKILPSDFVFDPAIQIDVGELLVNRASGSVSLLGSAAMVTENPYQLILSDKTFRIWPSGRTSRHYLYWLLNSRLYREQVEASVSGAEGLANNLPMSRLRSFRLPFPPRAEQRKLIVFLERETSAIGQAILTASRGIDLARERRAALISAAVTGKIDVGVSA